MIDARRAAWQLLRAVDAGRLFEAARDQALSGLNERDRRLAQEIAAGVLRRRRTLDRELIAVLGPRWRTTDPELRDLLRIGAYQLRHLTRVPPYAAVNSTVEAAKLLGARRAAFVNAVLRRVVEDIRGASTLAARYSHPDWLVGRWLARYGSASTETLLAHYNQPPPLVIQAARWPRERLERALTAADVDWREAPGGYGLIVRRSRPQALPGFEDGGFIVQGPGQARLLAHAAIPAGSVDAVWLDAPCTGTGTMSRHPDARWRVSPRRLEVARRQQATLLDAVTAVVRAGGWLVYSTCSLEPEENEAQVEAFLSRHPALVRDRDDLTVWPPDTGSDGGFIAVLRMR